MQKDNNANKYHVMSGLFLFLSIACGIAAVCLWRYLPEHTLFYYVPSGCAVVFFLAYVIVCAVACKKIEQGRRLFLLAWAIVLVSVILIGLSPIAAILWVFETIAESVHEAKTKN